MNCLSDLFCCSGGCNEGGNSGGGGGGGRDGGTGGGKDAGMSPAFLSGMSRNGVSSMTTAVRRAVGTCRNTRKWDTIMHIRALPASPSLLTTSNGKNPRARYTTYRS